MKLKLSKMSALLMLPVLMADIGCAADEVVAGGGGRRRAASSAAPAARVAQPAPVAEDQQPIVSMDKLVMDDFIRPIYEANVLYSSLWPSATMLRSTLIDGAAAVLALGLYNYAKEVSYVAPSDRLIFAAGIAYICQFAIEEFQYRVTSYGVNKQLPVQHWESNRDGRILTPALSPAQQKVKDCLSIAATQRFYDYSFALIGGALIVIGRGDAASSWTTFGALLCVLRSTFGMLLGEDMIAYARSGLTKKRAPSAEEVAFKASAAQIKSIAGKP